MERVSRQRVRLVRVREPREEKWPREMLGARSASRISRGLFHFSFHFCHFCSAFLIKDLRPGHLHVNATCIVKYLRHPSSFMASCNRVAKHV